MRYSGYDFYNKTACLDPLGKCPVGAIEVYRAAQLHNVELRIKLKDKTFQSLRASFPKGEAKVAVLLNTEVGAALPLRRPSKNLEAAERRGY